MRSGIKFSEGYFNPFSEMAKFYYGKNLDRYIQQLRLNKEPGAAYQYQSANSQILAMILERTSGKSLPEFLQEKIWEQAGMQYDASWNLDSEKHGSVKAFCCLNARALDFARFARLYSREGYYRDKEIIPSSWISKTFKNTTDSKDAEGYPYHFMWRVIDGDILFAKGILGQYIYIDRSRDLIIVRFGKKNKKVRWVELFKEIGAGFDSQSR
ncbi:MAG: serine hydrolase [Bacteroidota bacterium]|nr:serine hydrolase [Bacteroidota bacterium]